MSDHLEDASGEVPAPTPEPQPELAPVNGFGVPDWLVEPLFDATVAGLETMARTEVPPRLIPLTGRRHAKVSRANREQILSALGRHAKFTDAAFDVLFDEHEAEARELEGASADEVIGMIDRAEADASLAVCLLLAAGRHEDESEARYQRARCELRDLRARVPVEAVQPGVELVREEPPPTTAELRDRFVQFGARGVLDSKGLVLLVDGWNVSLGHIGAEKLEDKRRILEQALERYRSRTANKVMVVYDGRKVSWFWMPRAEGRTIARVFTEDQTADDFIVGELEAETGRIETPVVATSDRELRKRCIAMGAFVVSSEDLAAVLRL